MDKATPTPSPATLSERLSKVEHSLWILREHQTLHFGDNHNTTIEATRAHHEVIALRAEVERLAAQSAQAPAQAVQAARCACNDRPASECPGEWEPGCDLGNNPKYVRAYVDAGRTIPASGEIGSV